MALFFKERPQSAPVVKSNLCRLFRVTFGSAWSVVSKDRNFNVTVVSIGILFTMVNWWHAIELKNPVETDLIQPDGNSQSVKPAKRPDTQNKCGKS